MAIVGCVVVVVGRHAAVTILMAGVRRSIKLLPSFNFLLSFLLVGRPEGRSACSVCLCVRAMTWVSLLANLEDKTQESNIVQYIQSSSYCTAY
jgi:hypothetical protein